MNGRLFLSCLALSCLAGAAPAAEPARIDSPDRPARTRTFDFTYTATVTGLTPGETARVWVPIPSAGEYQEVELVSRKVPGEARITTEPEYNNRILFFEARANDQGELSLELAFRVTRKEFLGKASRGMAEDARALARFLRADAAVPIDGKPLDLLGGKTLDGDPLSKARTIYDVVNAHMRYSKEGTGWGRGDSVWACASGYGNCTDFHSLFISLARSQKVPARFEIGFPIPPERGEGTIGGYHCWARFHVKDRGWVPVDISEADKNPDLADYYFGNLTEDRVAFSTGRDITLVPKQQGGPINFFIYPHVEVGGKAHAQEKINRSFSYRDVAER
jgi:transglutaminase-like putative cysteine protease